MNSVFLTGATGFLGKVVLHQLLSRADTLSVTQINLLARPSRGRTAEDRVRKILEHPVFAAIPLEERPEINVFEGDLQTPRMGLTRVQYELLGDQTTHIIHCAASIEFDLPLPESYAANVLTTLELMRFSLGAAVEVLTAVSTAYVQPLHQQQAKIEERNATLPSSTESLTRAILNPCVPDATILRESGHPNSYTLTKSLAEHELLQGRRAGRLEIVRPSIISACARDPAPGWIDSYASAASVIGLIGGGLIKVMRADPESSLDLVPCDHVAEVILERTFAITSEETVVTHAVAGTNAQSPMAMCCHEIQRYFAEYPVELSPELRSILPEGRRYWPIWLRQEALGTGLMLAVASMTAPRKASKLWRTWRMSAQVRNSFDYFTHRTFNFESRYPLGNFNARAYMRLVCAGVRHYLMKREPTEEILESAERYLGNSEPTRLSRLGDPHLRLIKGEAA